MWLLRPCDCQATGRTQDRRRPVRWPGAPYPVELGTCGYCLGLIYVEPAPLRGRWRAIAYLSRRDARVED